MADQTAVRASEALNASLMAENAELRRHNAMIQDATAARASDGGGAASGDADGSTDETRR